MKLLLGTHVFLWLNEAPEKQNPAIRQALENRLRGPVRRVRERLVRLRGAVTVGAKQVGVVVIW